MQTPTHPLYVQGYTPMHFASKGGHRDIVVRLLAHGGRVNVANTGGRLPIHLARSSAVLDTLICGGAEVESITPEVRACVRALVCVCTCGGGITLAS